MAADQFNTKGKCLMFSPDDIEVFFGIPMGSNVSAFEVPCTAATESKNVTGPIPSPFGPDHEAFMNERLNGGGEKSQTHKGGRKFFAGCLKKFT